MVKKFLPIILGIFSFIIYLFTLAPSVVQIDAGELAAVQALPGIAHPTGYPLFTMIGYVWLLIPLPMEEIFQLNLLAAIFCSAAISTFVYSSRVLLDNLHLIKSITSPHKKNNKRSKKSEQNIANNYSEASKVLAISCGALILSFSRTFWFQSTSVEVYSLHLILINLIILFLFKGFLYGSSENISIKNPWFLFALFLALGFTNHMTTLLIIPGAAFIYFTKERFSRVSLIKIGIMLLIFFPILILIYSYLPIRAAQTPLINWGNPIDWENIIRHITGKQYQVWIFSSSEAAKKQFEYFINNLPAEFLTGLFISAAGVFSTYFYSKNIFLFLIITFLSTVLYSINYDIVDIDSYFLLAYVCLGFFAVFGAFKIIELLVTNKFSYSLAGFLLAVFIAVQAYFNFSKVDQSGNFIFEDYTKAVLSSVSKDAVIFSYQWDYFISESYYYQFVKNYRRDAAIIDKELLRRSWYYHQLNTAYPEILQGVKKEKQAFLKALAPFELDENFDPNLLEKLFRQLMTNIAAANLPERDFYIGPEIFENEMQRGEFLLPEGYTLIPDLLLFKAVKGNEYVPAKDPDFILRFPKNRNVYIDFIERFTGSMLVRRALYEMQFDKRERAKIYLEKIKSDLPGYIIPAGVLEAVGQ